MQKKELRTSLKQQKMQKIIRKKIILKDDDKIIIYTHPKQFSSMYIERINPTHIGVIWGKRNKKYAKIKGKNWIKIGKINFSELFTLSIDKIADKLIYWFNYGYLYFEQTGIVAFVCALFSAMLFYFLIFKISGGIK